MTNRDRMDALLREIRSLQRSIEMEGRQEEYISYLREIANNLRTPSHISEAEWGVMLPEERAKQLIQYYHGLRTEYLEMRKCAEAPTTMESINKWLEQPWVRAIITAGTLAEVAHIILHVLTTTGQFLVAPEVDPLQAD